MYAKIYASLWDGTLCGQWEAWSLFVYLLANCDQEGFIDIHPHAISVRSGIPPEAVARALTILEAPDPASRTPDDEGRRLVRIDEHRDWGWQIINYQRYRTMIDEQTVRAQTRERVRKFRMKRSVTLGNDLLRQAEVEVEAVKPNPTLRARARVERESAAPLKGNSQTPHPTTDPDDLTVAEWFDAVFWPRYPKQTRQSVARSEAFSLFRALSKTKQDELGEAIMAGLERYREEVADRPQRYIANPARWLKERRWEDA